MLCRDFVFVNYENSYFNYPIPIFWFNFDKNWLEVLSQHDFTKPEMSSSLKISRRKSSKGGNPMHVRDTFGLINGGSFYVIIELIW